MLRVHPLTSTASGSLLRSDFSFRRGYGPRALGPEPRARTPSPGPAGINQSDVRRPSLSLFESDHSDLGTPPTEPGPPTTPAPASAVVRFRRCGTGGAPAPTPATEPGTPPTEPGPPPPTEPGGGGGGSGPTTTCPPVEVPLRAEPLSQNWAVPYRAPGPRPPARPPDRPPGPGRPPDRPSGLARPGPPDRPPGPAPWTGPRPPGPAPGPALGPAPRTGPPGRPPLPGPGPGPPAPVKIL